MVVKYIISCLIFLLLGHSAAYAQATETVARDVMHKTEEALGKIKTVAYKINLKNKYLSQRDTVYTTAICSLYIAPKDGMGAYNLVDLEFAGSNQVTYGHRKYDGKQAFWAGHLVDSLHKAKPYVYKDKETIKSIVENYSNILLPEYLDGKPFFYSISDVKSIEVGESILLNTHVYVLSIAFKDYDDTRDNVETHYIRKSDYLPIAFSSFLRWENMEQYYQYEIEYMALNPDIPAQVFTIQENETIDAAARYAALKNNVKGFQHKTCMAIAKTNNIANILNENVQTNTSKNLPDFKIQLHNDAIINLKDLKGKVVLLDFWYRGCAPCLQAMPELIKLQEEYKDDLVIIGINSHDIKEDVADYAKYKNMNYLSTYKTGENISKALGIDVTAYPTTILYDKDGNMIQTESGYSSGVMRSLRLAIKKAVK